MKCIWRCVQKEGLATFYKDDDEVRRPVRRAEALPLGPMDKVDDVWLDVIAESPAGAKVRAFMDYVTTTWVEGRQFGPEVWNLFGNPGHQTNNDVEGWNHKINKLVRKSHPNVFEVVKLFQREQSKSPSNGSEQTGQPHPGRESTGILTPACSH
ncbi:uncharacterized protein LOC124256830 [Haliotis rubra]|uniref:uncharacterized protein LOC124256830 n=1 Tax=Haliotis rubra TaxID=36100 RepID=UPI001EE55FD8|nr:uncharacterized protein LOC124256830 [Haliotis rubra]